MKGTIDISDVLLFIVRIILITLFVVMLIVSTHAFATVMKNKEIDKTAVDIYENLASSNFVLKESGGNVANEPLIYARNVFNQKTIEDIGNNPDIMAIEPIRQCSYAWCAEFYKMSSSGYQKVGRVGYWYSYQYGRMVAAYGSYPQSEYLLSCPETPPLGNLYYNHATREFPIGIKSNEGIVPGRMKLHVYDTQVSRLSCAFEKAMKYSKMQMLTMVPEGNVAVGRIFLNTLCLLYQTDEEMDCRHVPGLTENKFSEFNTPLLGKKVEKIVVIPLKESAGNDCTNYGDTNSDGFIDDEKAFSDAVNSPQNIANSNPAKVLFCAVEKNLVLEGVEYD